MHMHYLLQSCMNSMWSNTRQILSDDVSLCSHSVLRSLANLALKISPFPNPDKHKSLPRPSLLLLGLRPHRSEYTVDDSVAFLLCSQSHTSIGYVVLLFFHWRLMNKLLLALLYLMLNINTSPVYLLSHRWCCILFPRNGRLLIYCALRWRTKIAQWCRSVY